MKKIALLCLITLQSSASNLIFKQGFENTALVKGTASGLSSTGLNLSLSVNASTETLAINSNGEFIFFMDVPVDATWNVDIGSLPDSPQQQSCTLSNFTGIMPTTGANVLQVVCNITAWKWDEMKWDEGGWN
jgi:hypothetical protein